MSAITLTLVANSVKDLWDQIGALRDLRNAMAGGLPEDRSDMEPPLATKPTRGRGRPPKDIAGGNGVSAPPPIQHEDEEAAPSPGPVLVEAEEMKQRQLDTVVEQLTNLFQHTTDNEVKMEIVSSRDALGLVRLKDAKIEHLSKLAALQHQLSRTHTGI